MKKTQTLKLNRDFRRLYSKGRYAVSGSLVVYTMKNRVQKNRLGLTTGKTIGNAVKRNRAKRLLRESYRLLEERLKDGYDIVLVARTRAVHQKCPQISKDMEYAMKKLGLIEHA